MPQKGVQIYSLVSLGLVVGFFALSFSYVKMNTDPRCSSQYMAIMNVRAAASYTRKQLMADCRQPVHPNFLSSAEATWW